MMKRHITSILLLFTTFACFAQDPHFSQYFASPLSLNPACTGFFDGDLRLAVNERRQWYNVGASYNTTSINADAKILADRIKQDDVLAVGLMGLFEQSLGNALQSNYISGSAAYHKSLGYEGKHALTLGVQVSMANVSLDYGKLTFASQFRNDGFDTTIPVSMDQGSLSNTYFDSHIGLLYAVRLTNINAYAGAALYHLLRPVESLLNPAGKRIPFRKTFHAGADIYLNPRSSLLFSGQYTAQSAATNQLIGTAYALKNNNPDRELTLYFGCWMRLSDAYIPYLGAEYGNFNIGLNYSRPYNNPSHYQPETFEISLIYRRKSASNSAMCPKF